MKRLSATLIVCTALAASACVGIPIPGMPAMPQAPYDATAMNDIQARMNAAPNLALPAVASLSCEQMYAEMIAAGAMMSGQLDPSFASNAKELQKASQPRLTPPTQAEVDRNQALVNQTSTQVAASTQGIDLQRMMALNTEFSARKCKTPQ